MKLIAHRGNVNGPNPDKENHTDYINEAIILGYDVEIDVWFVNKPDVNMNSIGAKGIGEIALIGFAAAVTNAVYNATGKRVRDLPITPAKLVFKGKV